MKAILAKLPGKLPIPLLRPACRTVLVLDADPTGEGVGAAHTARSDVQAHWFRYRGPLLLDSFSGTPAHGCPWAAVRDREPVTLVIRDAALDIERLASHGFGPTPRGLWQRHRLARQRRRERATDLLVWLGRHATAGARAAVQRETLDPGWSERLTSMQRDGLNIAAVVLPERLLAASHRRRDVPRFTALQEARHVRHVLVIDGVACFSRRVRGSDDAPRAARDIIDSLTHALDRWSLSRVALDAGDLPAAVSDRLDALLSSVPALVVPCNGCAAHSPGQATAYRAANASIGSCSARSLFSLSAAWRRRTARRRLRLLCAASGLPALGVALHLATAGSASVAAARVLDEQHRQLSSNRQAVLAEAAALHAEPERAQRFLAEFERLGESPDRSPGALLASIARVVTRFEALTLDAIAWSYRPHDARAELERNGLEHEDFAYDEFDGTVFVDAASLPAANPSDASRLAIELDGRIGGALPLRDAQARVNAFADELRTLETFAACRVMASPLSAAARSETAGRGDVDAGPGPGAGTAANATIEPAGARPHWRLRCTSSSIGS